MRIRKEDVVTEVCVCVGVEGGRSALLSDTNLTSHSDYLTTIIF